MGDNSHSRDCGAPRLTEHFGPNTGVRRYSLACDILSTQLTYDPKPHPDGIDCIYFEWIQSGAAESWLTITDMDDDTLYEEYSELRTPGWQFERYLMPSYSEDSCYYYFELKLAALFNSAVDTTIRDSIYIIKRIDTTILPIEITGYGIFDLEDEYPNTCLHPSGKWWVVWVDVEDLLFNDTATFQYHWSNGHSSENVVAHFKESYYPDDSLGQHYLNTYSDTVLVRLGDPSDPYDEFENGDTLNILSVSIYDADGNPIDTTGYGGTKDADYKWVAQFYYPYYDHVCSTPCTTCTGTNPPHGCPMLYSWNGKAYGLENNILPQSEGGIRYSYDFIDFYPLFSLEANTAGEYDFEIREDEQEITYFDQIELYSVDAPDDSPLAIDDNNSIVVLTKDIIRPVSAVTHNGEDVLSLIQSGDGQEFTATGEGYIDVVYQFNSSGKPSKAGAKAEGGVAPPPPEKPIAKGSVPTNKSGINYNLYDLYAFNAKGDYEKVSRMYPRVNPFSTIVHASDFIQNDSLKIRLEWTYQARIDSLPFIYTSDVAEQPLRLRLLRAFHSTDGDVAPALESPNDDDITLSPGQSIQLAFESPADSSKGARVLVMKAVGAYETDPGVVKITHVDIPDKFEFAQNYPNPFNPSTSFKFALPEAADVRLEIYNILGRRVATVTDGRYEAGLHKVTWDGRGDGGWDIASGVYFAKIEAGDFSSTKKVVVVK